MFAGAEPLTYTQHRRWMSRISKQMNLQGITGYTFRHTIITDVDEVTHDANIAAAVAGHSKTSITIQGCWPVCAFIPVSAIDHLEHIGIATHTAAVIEYV